MLIRNFFRDISMIRSTRSNIASISASSSKGNPIIKYSLMSFQLLLRAISTLFRISTSVMFLFMILRNLCDPASGAMVRPD